MAGHKNSTRPLVITSEIWKGQVNLPKGRVLWEELLEEVILHISPLCSLLYYLFFLLKEMYMCLQDE